ncbi:unnamed protein product [marine sediment metagenome]|uniref:Uncharacterized protein n=1 Tax=marine sediment metagenome TaxID=412755 RepID=X0TLK2_9ZZZZ
MVVRPEEVLGKLMTDELVEIDQLEPALDLALGKFDGTKMTIGARMLGNSKRVKDVMLEKYREAGWKIQYQFDQRDGDFYYFSEQGSGTPKGDY